MTSFTDKLRQLEQKIAFMESCHREQVRYLVRRIGDLEDELKKLSSVLPDLAAIEKLALDAYVASNEEAQDALAEADRVVSLDIPHHIFFNQLATVREARGQTLARRRNT